MSNVESSNSNLNAHGDKKIIAEIKSSSLKIIEPDNIQAKPSDFALELKLTPKNTCIPGNCRPYFSESSLTSREIKSCEPDKSWSVIFFGAKGKNLETNF